MGCLKLIRSLLAFILSILLLIIVVVGIPLASLSTLTAENGSLKTWLKEGEVYENLAEVLVDMALDEIDSEKVGFLAFASEGQLKEIVTNTLTSNFLQTNVEKVIDATYAWFNGDTEKIEFELELTDVQQDLDEYIRDLFEEKFQSMPTCTNSEDIDSAASDPFSAECLPPGFDSSQFIEESVPKELFLEGKVSTDEIFKDEFFHPELTKRVQDGFGIYKNLATVVIVTILVLSLIIFIITPGFKNGFLFTGIVWVLGSCLLLFGSFYIRRNFNTFFDEKLGTLVQGPAEPVVDLLKEPASLCFQDVVSGVSTYGLIMAVLGVILVFGGVVLKLSKRKYYIREEVPEDEVEQLEEAVNLGGTDRISKSIEANKVSDKITDGGTVSSGQTKASEVPKAPSGNVQQAAQPLPQTAASPQPSDPVQQGVTQPSNSPPVN